MGQWHVGCGSDARRDCVFWCTRAALTAPGAREMVARAATKTGAFQRR